MTNKRYLVLDLNNIAINDILCEPDFPIESNMIEVPITPLEGGQNVGIGWIYENGIWVEPPIPIPTAEQNKETAISLLQQTDWTTIADVGNPQTANPYLANQVAFIQWRSQVRAIAVTPIEGNLEIFNQMPTEDWKPAP